MGRRRVVERPLAAARAYHRRVSGLCQPPGAALEAVPHVAGAAQVRRDGGRAKGVGVVGRRRGGGEVGEGVRISPKWHYVIC